MQRLNSEQPIFQSIFAEGWQGLPPVMHKHYANRPYSRDRVTVKGVMKIEMHPLMRCFMPLIRLSKVLVPYHGKDIAVTVHFHSNPNDARYEFERIFHLPDGDYNFRSYMLPVGGNEVIDWTKLGIGWNASYSYDGKRVLMTHKRYKIRLFGRAITFPLEWLFGRSLAWEEAIDENSFNMTMEMQHFPLGRLYSYSGEFAISEVKLER